MQRLIAVVAGNGSVTTTLIRGLGDHVRQHRLPWSLVHLDPAEFASPKPVARHQAAYAGVVGFCRNRHAGSWVVAQGCPVVQLGYDDLPHGTCTTIRGDDTAIGIMAARHLLDQGYRSFACIGRWSHVAWARRTEAFIATLAGKGSTCHVYDHDRHRDAMETPVQSEAALIDWLRSLPHPVAVFVHQDRAASYLAGICTLHGVQIPHQVALLGVDDVSDVCLACQPPLSSVALPWMHAGRQAGLCLQRMLSGASGSALFLRPLRVVARASTAALPLDDPLAARCVQWIRRSPGKPHTVADLARRLAVDVSTLHRHLVAATGAGAREHLHRARIAQACTLLLDSDLAIAAIATRTGFASRQRFTAMFRAQLGMTPQAYRCMVR